MGDRDREGAAAGGGEVAALTDKGDGLLGKASGRAGRLQRRRMWRTFVSKIFILLPPNKKKKGDTSQNCLEIIVSYLRTNTSIENVQKQAWTSIFVNFADLCANQQHNKTGRVCPAWQTRLHLYIRILQIFYYVVFMDRILFPNCCGIFVIFYCRG